MIVLGLYDKANSIYDKYFMIREDERNNFIGRVRTMASAVARLYVEQREAMGFPLIKG